MTEPRDKYSIMEREFFEYEEYDIHHWILTFLICNLKKQLGRFQPGTILPRIDIDLVNGEMSLWRDTREPADLKLLIGFKIMGEGQCETLKGSY